MQSELTLLKSIKTGKGLIKLVQTLRKNRRQASIKGRKRISLSPVQRKLILEKTNARCHVCGIELDFDNFHADHIKTHSSGGNHLESNYLASCPTCNGYRWHFSPEELKIILKLGVWAKGLLLRETILGMQIANEFVKHELGVRKRKMSKEENRKHTHDISS